MALTFGTDGVRGDARTGLKLYDIELLGRVAAKMLTAQASRSSADGAAVSVGVAAGVYRAADGVCFAVGRDQRESSPALAAALLRGAQSAGVEPVDLGVLPTPAVSSWCGKQNMPGAMVSGSHNPWHDNGVKLFTSCGEKLSDVMQVKINEHVQHMMRVNHALHTQSVLQTQPVLSDVCEAQLQAVELHTRSVIKSLQGRSLDGVRIVVDCANGAASHVARDCFRLIGAEVEVIHNTPNGRNINRGCGSLYPEKLQAAVVSSNADAGVAFDGDADRVIAVDHTGAVVDGDQILAVCAIDRRNAGLLKGDGVVVTVMANLGLRRAMAAHDISVVETPVGDRYVHEAMTRHGYMLGGEQSGHIIFLDLASTGDGLLTAVQLLDTMKRSGVSLADLVSSAMKRSPQVLVNVPVPPVPQMNVSSPQLMQLDTLSEILSGVGRPSAERLADSGRVLVRPSGTEPVVRVMVEADDMIAAQVEAELTANSVANILERVCVAKQTRVAQKTGVAQRTSVTETGSGTAIDKTVTGTTVTTDATRTGATRAGTSGRDAYQCAA